KRGEAAREGRVCARPDPDETIHANLYLQIGCEQRLARGHRRPEKDQAAGAISTLACHRGDRGGPGTAAQATPRGGRTRERSTLLTALANEAAGQRRLNAAGRRLLKICRAG